MPGVAAVVDWLGALAPGWLALWIVGLSFVENVFPPIPSDTLIGILVALAAAAGRPLTLLITSVIIGSAAGGITVYALGRRYGAEGLQARMRRQGTESTEQRLEAAYARYGLLALFVGRLIPGVRSIVPVFAGALRLHAGLSLSVILLASACWYLTLALLAYQVGGNWEALSARMAEYGRAGGIIGGAILAVLVLAWWRRRRVLSG
jgi:membrane protein DedA with SNARE-associated domain